MNKYIYGIYDCVTGYIGFTVEENDAVAKRNFEYAVSQPNSIMIGNLSDFELHRLGSISIDTGTIMPESPVLLESAVKAYEVSVLKAGAANEVLKNEV